MKNIGNIIKSLQNIMRKDPGVSGDAQRIEQLGWLISLKIIDDKDQELELLHSSFRSPIDLPLDLHGDGVMAQGRLGDVFQRDEAQVEDVGRPGDGVARHGAWKIVDDVGVRAVHQGADLAHHEALAAVELRAAPDLVRLDAPLHLAIDRRRQGPDFLREHRPRAGADQKQGYKNQLFHASAPGGQMAGLQS